MKKLKIILYNCIMDNYYKKCAGIMNDSRIFTDYRPKIEINEMIKKNNKITNNYEYVKFLQSGGKKISDTEWIKLKKELPCDINGCVHNYGTATTPEEFIEEMKNYNEMMKGKKFNCKQYADYRID